MPMSGDELGLLMLANVNGLSDAEKRDRSAVFRAMGRAIVTHITTSAQLSIRMTDSGWQTTTGPGAATAGPLVLLVTPVGNIV